jgi:hypothetical protein
MYSKYVQAHHPLQNVQCLSVKMSQFRPGDHIRSKNCISEPGHQELYRDIYLYVETPC